VVAGGVGDQLAITQNRLRLAVCGGFEAPDQPRLLVGEVPETLVDIDRLTRRAGELGADGLPALVGQQVAGRVLVGGGCRARTPARPAARSSAQTRRTAHTGDDRAARGRNQRSAAASDRR